MRPTPNDILADLSRRVVEPGRPATDEDIALVANIRSTLKDTNLPDAYKLQFMREARGLLEDKLTRIRRERQEAIDDHKIASEKVEALKEVGEWLSSPRLRKDILQNNECSRLHQLVEAFSSRRVLDVEKDEPMHIKPEYLADMQTFVVRHDWYAAVGESLGKIEGGEIVMPYPKMAFEFKSFGKTVIILVQVNKETGGIEASPLFAMKNGWWVTYHKELGQNDEGVGYLIRQIETICVMLDAKVAEYEVVRQPTALNAKRAKTGKLPLYDYHVIDLSRRLRARSSRSPDHATGTKRRLHFRRGHWRHYENHKTWINWMLVGNPDLGFVDKHYRL